MPPPNGSDYDWHAEQSTPVSSPWLLPDPSASGGVSTLNSTQPANGTFACTLNGWNAIQAVANGLVLGNCAYGWTLGATRLDYAPSGVSSQGDYYWGGWIGAADYSSCGYVNNDRVTYTGQPNGTPNTCTDPNRRNKADYVYCTASPCGGPNGEGTNLDIWTGPNQNDGVHVANPHDCPEYANYRPWSSNNYPRDYKGITAPAGSNRLLLRYLARYSSTDGSGYWAMVQDPYSSAGQWAFVPWSCFF
jgi:hypothetical protein